jgi:hypothetical protein
MKHIPDRHQAFARVPFMHLLGVRREYSVDGREVARATGSFRYLDPR